MTSLDAFLELEPMQTSDLPAARAGGQQPEPSNASAASADTAINWLLKVQQQKQWHQQQEEDCSSVDERCTISPGYSLGSAAGAALEGSHLELEDDACSLPALPHQKNADLGATNNQLKLLDGTLLAATTFWDDLAAQGSVFQYCLQR